MKKFLYGLILGLLGIFISIILSPLLLLLVIYSISILCFEAGYDYGTDDDISNTSEDPWED